MKLTSDVKQRSQHNSPNPNNSYKTKKKFTGSYTKVNPVLGMPTGNVTCSNHAILLKLTGCFANCETPLGQQEEMKMSNPLKLSSSH